MGMAASQARFLGLTAKKTNIEYEGQQINQQRMALGSQTASYYTQMLGIGVPTPPSIDQFTNMVYSWKPVGGQVNTIVQMVPKSGTIVNGLSHVVRYSWKEEVTAADKKGEAVLGGTTGAPEANGNKLSVVARPDAGASTLEAEEYRAVQKLLWLAEPANSNKTEAEFNAAYNNNYETFPHKPLYKYADATKVGSVNVYLLQSDVVSGGTLKDKAMQYKVGQVTQNKEDTQDVMLKFDDAGRPITIKPSGASEEMALSASTFKDEVAYDMAMNRYEMEKYQYNKNMEDMNSKIKIMQEQDRSLELRLKQLDTEQKAVSTEMEAVGKIIQKNVETTFKTFG